MKHRINGAGGIKSGRRSKKLDKKQETRSRVVPFGRSIKQT